MLGALAMSVASPPSSRAVQSGIFRAIGVRSKFAWLLLLSLSAVLLPPIVLLIITSFRTASVGLDGTFTMDNWARLLSRENLESIRNTFTIAYMSSVLAVPLGVIFAWMEAHTDSRIAKRISLLLLLPLVFSPMLSTLAWRALASPNVGFVNRLADSALPGDVVFFNIYSMAGMVLVTTLYFVPIVYLAVRGPLRGIDAALIESARTAGARLSTTILRIVVPVVAPAIGAAILLTSTIGIGMLAVVTILGPSARIDTLQLDLYVAMLEPPADAAYAATIGSFLLVVAVLNLFVYRFLIRRRGKYQTVSGKGFRPPRVRLGRAGLAANGLLLSYLLLAVVLPYGALVLAALQPFAAPDGGLLGELSTRNFVTLFNDRETGIALRNTVVLAIAGAAATTAIAGVVGYVSRRVKGAVSSALEAVSLMPLAFPSMSFGIGVLWYALLSDFGKEYIWGTLWIIYIAQMAVFLPLGVQVVGARVMQMGGDLEEAARVAGVTAVDRVRKVVIPLIRSTLGSAWIILALYALTEVGLSVFLYRARTVTLAVKVFTQATLASPRNAYAGAVVLATVGLVAIAIAQRTSGAADRFMDRA